MIRRAIACLLTWMNTPPAPVDDNAINGVAQERARRSASWGSR